MEKIYGMNAEEKIVRAFERADFSRGSTLKGRLRTRLFGTASGKQGPISGYKLSLDDLSMVSAAGDLYADPHRPRDAEKDSEMPEDGSLLRL